MGRKRRLLVGPGPEAGAAPAPGAGTAAPAPFDPQARGEWWWRQPHRLHRDRQLEVDGRVVATMSGSRGFARTIRAAFEAQSWVIHRRFAGGLDVRAEGLEEVGPALRFVRGFFLGGGHLETRSGERLEVKRTGFFTPGYDLRTAEGDLLLRARTKHGFLRFEAAIEIEDAARRRDDLPLLVLVVGVLATTPPRQSHG